MATLNIKGFPDRLYEELRNRAKKEHRSVSQQVIHLLDESLHGGDRLSIMDLKGLGKEQWANVDPAEHVRLERESWD